MRVRVNGEEREIPEGASVPVLLAALGLEPARVAVERNRLVVRRASWAETTLAEGDELEILTFVGGG